MVDDSFKESKEKDPKLNILTPAPALTPTSTLTAEHPRAPHPHLHLPLQVGRRQPWRAPKVGRGKIGRDWKMLAAIPLSPPSYFFKLDSKCGFNESNDEKRTRHAKFGSVSGSTGVSVSAGRRFHMMIPIHMGDWRLGRGIGLFYLYSIFFRLPPCLCS